MLAKLRFVVIATAANAANAEHAQHAQHTAIMRRPLYHYVGNAPPPNDRWTLFQPYQEFEVDGHLCRAHSEPTCTWFNAKIIDVMNNSIHNRSVGYYTHVPFQIHDTTTKNILDYTESKCVQFCNERESCAAVAFARDHKICFVVEDYMVDLEQLRAETKIPRIMYYIKKMKRINPNVVDHYLDHFKCRLNLFRCPS